MAERKKLSNTERDLCRMITPEFRASHPHLFKAQRVKEGDKPSFSITMLFPKDASLTGKTVDGKERTLAECIKNAKIVAFGADKALWPKDLESPVRDGDSPDFLDQETGKQKDGYANHWVIKAKSSEDQRPSVIGPDMEPITLESGFIPGCYARAYVYAYAWEYMKKKGIGFIVDHVQKTRDGKAFGGRKSADQVFSPISAPPSASPDADEEHDFR